MSHANGQVRFSDGLVLHVEYNGTSGFFLTRLFTSKRKMREHWRAEDDSNEAKCTCGRDEQVVLATDYGLGIQYDGRACRYCMAITDDPGAPWKDEMVDPLYELPEWWQ